MICSLCTRPRLPHQVAYVVSTDLAVCFGGGLASDVPCGGSQGPEAAYALLGELVLYSREAMATAARLVSVPLPPIEKEPV